MENPIRIDARLLDAVSAKAQVSERKRTNFNFHSHYADPINRMLNAMEPGTYARPHKHEAPDKREVFIVLRGRLVVVFYDDEGTIVDQVLLDAAQGSWGVEIPPRVWHSVLALETGSVVYEIKDGPYEPMTDKDFAPWAPAEGDPNCAAYMQSILEKLKL